MVAARLMSSPDAWASMARINKNSASSGRQIQMAAIECVRAAWPRLRRLPIGQRRTVHHVRVHPVERRVAVRQERHVAFTHPRHDQERIEMLRMRNAPVA